MYMEDARHFCQQRHGDLVSITSKEENTFLWKQVSIFIFNCCSYRMKLTGKEVLTALFYACEFTAFQNLWVLLYWLVNRS